MGVVTHTVLAHPDSAHARVAHQLHGTVSHTGARPQQQDGNARCRDLDHPFFVRDRDGSILSAKGTVFEVQKGHPVPHLRQRLQVWPDHARHLRHGLILRA